MGFLQWQFLEILKTKNEQLLGLSYEQKINVKNLCCQNLNLTKNLFITPTSLTSRPTAVLLEFVNENKAHNCKQRDDCCSSQLDKSVVGLVSCAVLCRFGAVGRFVA